MTATPGTTAIDPEAAVLGCALADPDTWPTLSETLTEDHFERVDRRHIWRAISGLVEQGKRPDPLTIADVLNAEGRLAEVGGLATLGALASNAPASINARHHAARVREGALRRRISEEARALLDLAGLPGADVVEALAAVEQRVRALHEQASGTDGRTPAVRNLLDLSALAATAPRPREWIRYLWLSPHPTLLAALGGMGKTLLVLQLAVALAGAIDFMGTAGRRLRVLMWLCEDDSDEIHRRLADVCSYFGVDLAELADWLTIDARVGLENTLMTAEFGRLTWTSAFEELRAQVNDTSADVLVLDNIAQVFGAKMSEPHDVTTFVNGITGLVRGRQFAPILVGHTARAQGSEFFGSGAWENACRMRWYLGDRLPDEKVDEDEPTIDGVRYLARRKSNYSAKDYIRFELRDGVLVPEDVAEESGGIVGEIRRRKARTVVLEGLRALQEMGKTASDSPSANYLPKLVQQFNLAAGLTKRELEDAMRQLMRSGQLRRAEVGAYANRAPKFGLVEVTE